MAFQTRQRDPLLDSTMAEALERRGKELAGIALVLLGLSVAAMLWSYSPDDPSWVMASDSQVQNWLGRLGASIASPLIMIAGKGAWGIALALFAWGLRTTFHRGAERALGRVIFLPIAVAVLCLYCATMVPGAGWQESFGLGGLFGDTVLSILLTALPLPLAASVKVLAFGLGLANLAIWAFVLGFTIAEIKAAIHRGALGLVMLYAALFAATGKAASASRSAAARLQSNAGRGPVLRAEHHENEIESDRQPIGSPSAGILRAPPPIWKEEARRADDDWPEQSEADTAGARTGLLSFLRPRGGMPEPELVEPQLRATEPPLSDDARLKARIAQSIRSRLGTAISARQPTSPHTPPLRARGPQPLVLGGERLAEPPLTAPEAAESQWQDNAAEVEVDAQDATPPPPLPTPARPQSVVQHSQVKPQPSRRAQEEAQPPLKFDEPAPTKHELPPLNLLGSASNVVRQQLSDDALQENARMLETVLDDYGVKGDIVSVRPGPVVTMYELEPAPGLKASRVIGLSDDIARSMSALSARVSTVPGRSVIGIELPNENRESVMLREIISHRSYGDGTQKLPLALGKDIGGGPMVADLAKMPHLLIAGTTGSGKSVAINTMILSLLYKLTPEECRLIMIDPKMLELSVYDGIPHLLSPVVTDPKKAVVALKWVVAEMEERYRKMSKMGVRNIGGYNERVKDALSRDELFSRTVQTGFDDDTGDPVFETEEFAPVAMPYIVVVVDEMADLMMVAGKEIEACIQRLAQMARASGIHLIMATQRPSVDVITGTIKANFPTRISFQVTSKVDSRTILGEQGAEQLLGMGDMLYMAGGAKITRCHGPFVSDEEVEEIVNFLKQFGPPDYKSGVVEGPDEDKESDIDAVLGLGGNTNGEDALYDQAVAIVAHDRKCSTSYIQRKLAIGYNKAARLVEQMEDEGVVSAANHVGKREILLPEQ